VVTKKSILYALSTATLLHISLIYFYPVSLIKSKKPESWYHQELSLEVTYISDKTYTTKTSNKQLANGNARAGKIKKHNQKHKRKKNITRKQIGLNTEKIYKSVYNDALRLKADSGKNHYFGTILPNKMRDKHQNHKSQNLRDLNSGFYNPANLQKQSTTDSTGISATKSVDGSTLVTVRSRSGKKRCYLLEPQQPFAQLSNNIWMRSSQCQ